MYEESPLFVESINLPVINYICTISECNSDISLVSSLVLLRTAVAGIHLANMLAVLLLIATVFPWTLVEGRKGCWAESTGTPSKCIYGQVIPGGPDLAIQYSFISRFDEICCKALQCTNRRCSIERVGCGQSINSAPIKTKPLPWMLDGVEPIMRCFNYNGTGVYYSFTVDLLPWD